LSKLSTLISELKAKDPQLGTDLDREFKALSSRLSFGLNFERHSPEAVELPLRPIRKGDKVRILPTRSDVTAKRDLCLWSVKKINKPAKTADLESINSAESIQTTALIEDLIVIAEFRDTIYPGLVSTGKVSRGADKPWHTVINGENYHALKALTFTHRGKIDAIYIDPPYNTGAKDWKYNNDYVEGDDLYRHSKWLAMMERRLLVAKELLNPTDSVLIVTIDEKEYLRLGLLLEQVYPEARIQMVSSVISPKGSARRGLFSRADEYIFFVLFGDAYVGASTSDMLREAASNTAPVRWKSLLRSAGNGRRIARPNLFYPLHFDKKTGVFLGAGAVLPIDVDRNTVAPPKGACIVWPLGTENRELTWSLSRETMLTNQKEGFVRFGPWDGQSRTPYYLTSGQIQDIKNKSDQYAIKGKDADGALILVYGDAGRQYQPMTVWNQVSHSATEHGTGTVKSLIPGKNFPFPKSLYAVEDSLRFFVGRKNNAVVLDFFSGSGTTAHAVMRLNKQDGGQRQSISITNNEVAADEQKKLRDAGLRPGDADWEKWGICDYITKPRVAAAITGKTPTGDLIKGDYKFTDEFPMSEGFEENAEFFTLTYETPISVSHNRAFERIAPLLWMRAGSQGSRIDKLPADGWALAENYGLLVQLDNAAPFLQALKKSNSLKIAYIVTDDERRFQSLSQRLPRGVEPVRLYESYLTNFAFANGSVQ
jgi:adenine-specific DNA-methyltransferase